MCDPKSHRRCINKGILSRNNKNSGVIPPDSYDVMMLNVIIYNIKIKM